MSKEKSAPRQSEETEAQYKVGYKNPPLETRFQKGKSGNPSGKKKGLRNLASEVLDMLETPVKIQRDGRVVEVSTQEAAMMRLREKALQGDPRSLDRLLSLAAIHNSKEDLAPTLRGNEKEIIDVYLARRASGAAECGDGE